jgi:membrane protein DedA with SNARE-associated domain
MTPFYRLASDHPFKMMIFQHYLIMARAFFEHLGIDAETAFRHSFALAQPILDHYGYMAVFIAILVEGFGVPAPGQTMLMAGAFLAARGGVSITLVLVLAFLAGVLGNTLGYGLGRWGGRLLLFKVGISETRLQKMERLFSRYSGGVVFFGRFLDGLRQFSGIMAGSLQMPWWKFTVFNVLGATAWTALWGLGVYLFGKDIKTVFSVFHAMEPYVICGSLLTLILLVLYLRRNRKHRASAFY